MAGQLPDAAVNVMPGTGMVSAPLWMPHILFSAHGAIELFASRLCGSFSHHDSWGARTWNPFTRNFMRYGDDFSRRKIPRIVGSFSRCIEPAMGKIRGEIVQLGATGENGECVIMRCPFAHH